MRAVLVLAFASLACRPVEPAQSADEDSAPVRRTPEANALLARLQRLGRSDSIGLGHQDALAYGIGWKGDDDRSDVKSVCGAHPLVVGFDLGRLGNETNLDGVPFSSMRRWMIEAHERGSLVTVSFHEDNPVTGGDAWDTRRAVRELLPGGTHHDRFRAAWTRVAAFFDSVRTSSGARVPVLFRPLHEHNGDWFWWGRPHATDREFVELFRLVVDHLRDESRQEQLLFAFSPGSAGIETREDFLFRYPGDRYVDLIGFDHYYGDDATDLVRVAEMAVDVAAGRGKVAALTEFGLLGSYGKPTVATSGWLVRSFLEPLLRSPKARGLAYALAWRNADESHFFLPYPGHPDARDLRAVCDHPSILLTGDDPVFPHR